MFSCVVVKQTTNEVAVIYKEKSNCFTTNEVAVIYKEKSNDFILWV